MRLNGLTIAVTGGMGYVGSMTCKSLQGAGANVISIDNRTVEQNRLRGVNYKLGDYADNDILDDLQIAGVTGIVHCAGSSLVGPSISDPSLYYNNNVVKTIKMLDHFKEWCTKPFVVFSSSAATYGDPINTPIAEDEYLLPINPYGNTKMMIELILKDYDVAYGIKSFCYRYFNAAGADVWDNELGPEPGDTHLIPRIFEAYQQGNVFRLFGTDYDTLDGTCVRDYIHVCDLALAHMTACTELCNGGDSLTYNLGTGAGYSNKQIIDRFNTLVGKVDVHEMERRIGDPDELVANPSFYNMQHNAPLAFSDLDTIINSTKDFYNKCIKTQV